MLAHPSSLPVKSTLYPPYRTVHCVFSGLRHCSAVGSVECVCVCVCVCMSVCVSYIGWYKSRRSSLQ